VIYEVIDGSEGYYRCPVEPRSRSHMNLVFRLPSEAHETRFIAAAGEAELLNLKGHRSVGGCRASIYNAMPMEGVQALASFMDSFRRDHP
jgi:phosphoserine aminotransferase